MFYALHEEFAKKLRVCGYHPRGRFIPYVRSVRKDYLGTLYSTLAQVEVGRMLMLRW
jgi:hypothetical protein